MRPLAAHISLLALGLAIVATPLAAQETERTAHPMYDDRGALEWREKLDDALELARTERKVVFIEYGRET